MLVILPLGCYGLLVLAWWRTRPTAGLREALLCAALSWGVLVLGLSELLSLGAALSPLPLAVGWGIAGALIAALAWRAPVV